MPQVGRSTGFKCDIPIHEVVVKSKIKDKSLQLLL